MQVTEQLEVDVQVRITYKGADALRMSLVAIAPYAEGSRSATVTHDVDDPALAAKAVALCESIVEGHAQAVARRAMREAVESEGVAYRRGEL